MTVPFHSRAVQVQGTEMVAEAIMNNCSNLWTGTVKKGDRLVATGAGSTPESAMDAAIERAEAMAARSS